MPNINETAYPRFKNYISREELYKIYTPSADEMLLAENSTKGDFSKTCFLIMFKCFQRLGYFVNISDVPQSITEHVSMQCNANYDDMLLQSYDKSSSKKRHLATIREYLRITPYGKEARHVIVTTAADAAKTKDNDADIINVVIEELVKQRYELPAFSTLIRVSRNVRKIVYKTYYHTIYESLNKNTIYSIDNLLKRNEDNIYTSWNYAKFEPGKPSVKNLKEIILYLENIKSIEIDLSILSTIPDIKIKHFAAEAKTLDSARMRELEPYKKYTLAICFFKQRLSTVRDDLGEMFVKLVKSAQNRAKVKLNEYKINNSKVTDDLIFTLRDFITAFMSRETKEDRNKALENTIEKYDINDLLNKCDNYSIYSGDNYYPFAWECLKGSRATLYKVLNLLEMYSTTQDKTIEKAIEMIRKYKNSNKSEFLTIAENEIDLSWLSDKWWKLITGYSNRKEYPEKINKRNFEACVFYQIMNDLKSGDLCIKGSDIYSDYREQLIRRNL